MLKILVEFCSNLTNLSKTIRLITISAALNGQLRLLVTVYYTFNIFITGVAKFGINLDLEDSDPYSVSKTLARQDEVENGENQAFGLELVDFFFENVLKFLGVSPLAVGMLHLELAW